MSQYKAEHRRNNYDQVVLEIPKGKKELLVKLKSKYKTSINRVIVKALEDTYGIDLS